MVETKCLPSHRPLTPLPSNSHAPYPISHHQPPQERNLKDFFNAMEANVLRNIQRGDVTGSLVDEEARKRRESDPNLPAEAHDTFVEDGEMVESSFRKESEDDAPPATRVVRTISSMDDLLLTELTRTKVRERSAVRPPTYLTCSICGVFAASLTSPPLPPLP